MQILLVRLSFQYYRIELFSLHRWVGVKVFFKADVLYTAEEVKHTYFLDI